MSKNNLAYIATETTITVILGGKHRTIQVKSKNHRNDVVKALEKYKKSQQTEEDFKFLESFLAPIKRIGLESDNRLELDESENKLYLVGTSTPIEPGLADKILDFLDHSLPIEPLIKFWESCLRNPHFVAVQELFHFLSSNDLPITDDGAFLGYKKLQFTGGYNLPAEFGELFVDTKGVVRHLDGGIAEQEVANSFLSFVSQANNPDMVDVYSRTIHQKIGDIIKIDRVQFNEEERRQACGYGLHAGSFKYSFGGDVRVLVKVFPEDVIACNPNEQKLRTCKYQIISFVDSNTEVKELLINLTKERQEEVDSNDDDFDDDDSILNPFSEGDTVRAIEDCDDITEGVLYYITLVDGDDVCVIDDNGEESWYSCEIFEER